MATLLQKYPYKGEPWDTPQKNPEYTQTHKLIIATAEIGEPAIQKLTEYIEEHPDELELGCGVNGWTPLMWATVESTEEVVQLLIDYGTELDIQSNAQNTALNLAAYRANVANCKVLIDAGADMTIKNMYGEDVFMWGQNNHQLLELLNNAPNNPIRAKALQQRRSFSLDRTSDPSYYMTVDI